MITGFYAAILGLAFVLLSIRVIRMRRKSLIALGYGETPELLRAARVHGNFAEYVPLALLLIYFLEISPALATLIHGLCIVLLISRSLHAYGVSQTEEDYRFRTAGMSGTFAVIVITAIIILLYRLI